MDFKFRTLPAGSVELHDARRNRRWSEPIEPFALAEVPVTTQQYTSMVGEAHEESLPTVSVSWLDAVRFCNAASRRAGFDPVYEISGSEVVWLTSANGYRLPTEAEWEYACRAGTLGPHYGRLDEVAWTSRDDLEAPQTVGLKSPNAFGLYDMLGNVWEWCWDYLDPARYGDYRVFRGGGFADKAWSVRASTRRSGAPGMSHEDLGFRLARGGFDQRDVVQGWSAIGDAERSAASGSLPVGWTPRSR